MPKVRLRENHVGDTQGIVGAFPVAHLVSLFMSRLVPVSLFQVGLATLCSSLI